MWLIVAAPYILLWAALLFGLGTVLRSERRRELVIAILALVWALTLAGVVLLVVSLVATSGSHISGRQLLVSGAAVWLTDAVAFGLAFWELDCGGPVARALADARRTPDFQFPQDDNPQQARDGLGAPPLGLLLRLDHQLDRVQPDRHDAAHEERQGPDGGGVGARGDHGPPRRRPGDQHPRVSTSAVLSPARTSMPPPSRAPGETHARPARAPPAPAA